mmetsp:Transcript_6208/g.12794  ORF Transcript_6208/g.12794 Transcript_6208/m.12794 type:complete len:83 (-) Transcript_6208:2147-2395(-)
MLNFRLAHAIIGTDVSETARFLACAFPHVQNIQRNIVAAENSPMATQPSGRNIFNGLPPRLYCTESVNECSMKHIDAKNCTI